MTPTAEALNHIIRTRRSIFPPDYTGEEIPVSVIETILTNANYAPTHRLTEPWRFTVFREEGKDRLADFLGDMYKAQTPPELFSEAKWKGTREKVSRSSCVIAIRMAMHPEKVPEWEELAAVACAVQNMWLTATALQVGAYWSTPGNLDRFHSFLGLGPDEKCVGLFYMGYHRQPEKPPVRKPVEQKVTWVTE